MEGRTETLAAPAPAVDPEQDAAAREIAHGIQDCLMHLLVPRRWAVALYLYGCTVPEVARRLGWTPKKAENLVFRGMNDLRACLTAKGLKP